MARTTRYHRLPTEQTNPRSRGLDRLSPERLLRLMHREDLQALRAVARQQPKIARAVRLITTQLAHGGRLFFIGAGTSGRLGVMEAAECPPTFSTPSSLVQAMMAGGRQAVFRSQEGAEDDRRAARTAVRRRVHPGDVVVGITASGVTPFVEAALRQAARRRARTILITCHPRATIPASIRIVLSVGPEVLAGSTRLKAGTATKLVLNRLTLGAMARLGKTYGNLMVDVRPTSRKLRTRALGIIQRVARCSGRDAARYLRAAHGRVKPALLMATHGLNYQAALQQLAQTDGSLQLALERTAR